MIAGRIKFLIGVSLVIVIALVVLSQIPIKVHLSVELESTYLEGELQNDVPSFLAVGNNQVSGNGIKVRPFASATLPYETLYDDEEQLLDSVPGKLTVTPDDYTSGLILNGINLKELELEVGNFIEIDAIKTDADRVKLQIHNYQRSLELMNSVQSYPVRFQRAYTTIADAPWEDPLVLHNFNPEIIEVEPSEAEIGLRFSMDTNQTLAEDDVIEISKLSFMQVSGEKTRSTLLNAKITIEETGKVINLGKNKTVMFQPEDVWQVTELTVSGNKVALVFDGETDGYTLGNNARSYVPSMLEYIYTNNFLIILFNSFLVIITFFISISKENKAQIAAEKEDTDGSNK